MCSLIISTKVQIWRLVPLGYKKKVITETNGFEPEGEKDDNSSCVDCLDIQAAYAQLQT